MVKHKRDEDRQYDELSLEIDENNLINATYLTHDDKEETKKAYINDDKYLLDDIQNDNEDLKSGALDGREKDILRLGRNLFRAVFPGEIGSLFRKAYQKVIEDHAVDRSRWLRVILEVHEDSLAHAWSLEFIYSEDDSVWLSTNRPTIAFSQHTELNKPFPLGNITKKPPINVLVVISKPCDLRGVISSTVLEDIKNWTQAIESDEEEETVDREIDVQVLGKVLGSEGKQIKENGFTYHDQPATWRNLSDLMKGTDWLPDVLHFIGHGDYEKRKGSLALIKKEDDKCDWVSALELKNIFTTHQPWLVILQACESAQSGSEPGFMSLADQLYRLGIPAVVAMQFSITNKSASLFAKGFYEALRKGMDVDEAVQEGRYKITTESRWSQKQFGSPVLFTYYPGGIITKKGRKSAAQGLKPPVRMENELSSAVFDPILYVTRKIEAAVGYLQEVKPNLYLAKQCMEMAKEKLDNYTDEEFIKIGSTIEEALDSFNQGLSTEDAVKDAVRFLMSALEVIKSSRYARSKPGVKTTQPTGGWNHSLPGSGSAATGGT